MWFFTDTLISYHIHSHTNTHANKHTKINTDKDTAHSGANRLTHPFKYILTPHVIRSQQLSVLN